MNGKEGKGRIIVQTGLRKTEYFLVLGGDYLLTKKCSRLKNLIFYWHNKGTLRSYFKNGTKYLVPTSIIKIT